MADIAFIPFNKAGSIRIAVLLVLALFSSETTWAQETDLQSFFVNIATRNPSFTGADQQANFLFQREVTSDRALAKDNSLNLIGLEIRPKKTAMGLYYQKGFTAFDLNSQRLQGNLTRHFNLKNDITFSLGLSAARDIMVEPTEPGPGTDTAIFSLFGAGANIRKDQWHIGASYLYADRGIFNVQMAYAFTITSNWELQPFIHLKHDTELDMLPGLLFRLKDQLELMAYIGFGDDNPVSGVLRWMVSENFSFGANYAMRDSHSTGRSRTSGFFASFGF